MSTDSTAGLLAEHQERIGVLDAREATHFQDLGQRLQDLGTRLAGVHGTVTDQAEILRSLQGLDITVSELATQIAELAPEEEEPPSKAYKPIPAPRWWALRGEEREAAVGRLRAWVRDIYRPSYGFLSASLGPCWESHPLALFTLDWLSELWSVLYLQEKRGTAQLAGQAEFQCRYLPAAAEQLATLTSRCEHATKSKPGLAVAR
jgi:hypothetical protein